MDLERPERLVRAGSNMWRTHHTRQSGRRSRIGHARGGAPCQRGGQRCSDASTAACPSLISGSGTFGVVASLNLPSTRPATYRSRKVSAMNLLNLALWIVQGFLALFFLAAGAPKLIV